MNLVYDLEAALKTVEQDPMSIPKASIHRAPNRETLAWDQDRDISEELKVALLKIEEQKRTIDLLEKRNKRLQRNGLLEERTGNELTIGESMTLHDLVTDNVAEESSGKIGKTSYCMRHMYFGQKGNRGIQSHK